MTTSPKLDLVALRQAVQRKADNGTVGALIYTMATADLLALLDRVEEAEKDAERLDFVLENMAWLSQLDPTMHQLMTQDEDEEYIALSGEGEAFRTPREAIDAAIAIAKQGATP